MFVYIGGDIRISIALILHNCETLDAESNPNPLAVPGIGIYLYLTSFL